MKVFPFLVVVSCAVIFMTTQIEAVKFVFKDPLYSFQALRAVAGAVNGAADIGECLVTSYAIKEGDDEDWYMKWNQLAQRLEKEARASQKAGHMESARAAFLRASNYYRTAEFMLPKKANDQRMLETARKSREMFREAIKGLSPPVIEVRIPFENTTLPGYLCLVASGDTPRPLVIIQTGFDGTAEELYYQVAEGGVKRGYHCLLFEGPGQGAVIREQGIPFRPNWETVITPVVDYALTIKGVDKDRMALMGLSFGGYLVPRALAFEHRIKVGIANGGVYDFHAVCMQDQPPELEQELDNPDAAKEINQAIEKLMKTTPELRWAIGNGMFTFKAATPVEWLKMTRPYTLKGLVQNIKTKMLVVDSDEDFQMKGQASQLYDKLTSAKTFLLFKEKDGAGEHCQVGAYSLSQEKIYNWLDENL